MSSGCCGPLVLAGWLSFGFKVWPAFLGLGISPAFGSSSSLLTFRTVGLFWIRVSYWQAWSVVSYLLHSPTVGSSLNVLHAFGCFLGRLDRLLPPLLTSALPTA